MRTTLFALAGVALVFSGAARADDLDAQKVIDKAIAAHGGAEVLAKNKDKAAMAKGKMNIDIMGGLDSTLESFIGDDKFKHVMDLTIMGRNFNQVVCYDGKEMWIAVNGKVVMTIKGKDLDPLKEAIYSEKLAGLAFLKEKGIEFSLIGESKLGEQELIGIRVSKKDHKDVNLHFDKKTGMLTKVESRNLDFQSGQEVAEERILQDYKDLDGQKQPRRIIINRDGKKFVEMELTEMKLVDKLDDSVFAKPD
ncbi:MAG TPA: hypothetical protein VGZ47_14430 [Gemmataceae bacterium]|jgi:hypothetical protein|nr:hypothetical protein [Gemmataceae bacterium]